MKTRRARKISALCTGLIILGSLAYYFLPVIAGEIQARRDIANGKPRFLVYGERMDYDADQSAILQKKYGIEFDRVAGCVVTKREIRKWDAYNKKIKEHYKTTKGIDDVFVFPAKRRQPK